MIPEKSEKDVQQAIDDSVGEGGAGVRYSLNGYDEEALAKKDEYEAELKTLSKQELKDLCDAEGLSWLDQNDKVYSKEMLFRNLLHWKTKYGWVRGFETGPVADYAKLDREREEAEDDEAIAAEEAVGEVGEGGVGGDLPPPVQPATRATDTSSIIYNTLIHNRAIDVDRGDLPLLNLYTELQY